MVVHLVNMVLAILVNLVHFVHLVHLAKWILDIWAELDMFYYPKDKKIFHRISQKKFQFQSVGEKVQRRKKLTCIRKNISCVREKPLVEC